MGIYALKGLFPYGKSGLKFTDLLVYLDSKLSLPVWEEWIEMAQHGHGGGGSRRSLPVWEEWIEMETTVLLSAKTGVSSRMGRVD